jgi:cell fate (sporulation/competence/biofilm development) regulator YlbF (YheA/YmcA/DUF963 family)
MLGQDAPSNPKGQPSNLGESFAKHSFPCCSVVVCDFNGVGELKNYCMTMTTADTNIHQKIRELCQTILDQPEFQAMRRDIDAFLGDEKAQGHYQMVATKGDLLQQKQQMGLPLEGNEISDFERDREALLNNPVARSFLDAQQQMHRLQESVNQYLGKTFELGRVPEVDDLSSGCGPSCGCGH